jgi:hypothetical protein
MERRRIYSHFSFLISHFSPIILSLSLSLVTVVSTHFNECQSQISVLNVGKSHSLLLLLRLLLFLLLHLLPSPLLRGTQDLRNLEKSEMAMRRLEGKEGRRERRRSQSGRRLIPRPYLVSHSHTHTESFTKKMILFLNSLSFSLFLSLSLPITDLLPPFSLPFPSSFSLSCIFFVFLVSRGSTSPSLSSPSDMSSISLIRQLHQCVDLSDSSDSLQIGKMDPHVWILNIGFFSLFSPCLLFSLLHQAIDEYFIFTRNLSNFLRGRVITKYFDHLLSTQYSCYVPSHASYREILCFKRWKRLQQVLTRSKREIREERRERRVIG